jgi:hypothetical protein
MSVLDERTKQFGAQMAVDSLFFEVPAGHICMDSWGGE